MDRNVRALILALLCVVAVSFAAATLANPQQVGGSGPGSGTAHEPGDSPGDEGSSGDGSGSAQRNRGGQAIQYAGACVPLLLSVEFLLAALLVIVGSTWLLRRRENLAFALAIVGPVTLFAFPVWLVMTDCGSRSPKPTSGSFLPAGTPAPNIDPGSVPGGDSTNQLLPLAALVALLVVLAVVVAALLYRASDDDTVDDDPMPEMTQPRPDAEQALSAMGVAAGDAADRIEGAADVDNEVYRAWREMTDHVAVSDPETSTPREFADAARDAGMAASDVAALTDLFEEVRYGGETATEDREDAAVAALRRIESTYADGGDE